jgi:3-phosphoglycerate kinase
MRVFNMPETITQYASSEVVPLPEDVAIDSNLEALRQILSAEQNRDVTYKEATDIGQSLIDFFNILAGAS